MRISILHLSDLHLEDNSGIHASKIDAMANALSIHKHIDTVIVIVSGDVAAAGTINQYKTASQFLGRLVSTLRTRFSISEKNTKVLIVPGNHDIDWSHRNKIDSQSIRKFSEEQKLVNLESELMCMDNYFSFSNGNKCFFTRKAGIQFGQLFTRKILHFDNGYRIEANLINTAPFSCSEDDGLHFLPEDAIKMIDTPSNGDLSLVVMHHSPDWFEFSQKKELESIIANRCSLAFYGHEHIIGTQCIEYDNGSRILKQANGAWWHNAAPTDSQFYASALDTESRQYSLCKFTWDSKRTLFTSSEPQNYILMPKLLTNAGLLYREEYVTSLMADSKSTISENITDYFVFPTLRFNASKEYARGKTINNSGEFISFIKENKFVAITGGSSSGKTTLLKMLFKELQSKYVTLFCGTDDITGRSQENILKELVQSTYGADCYSIFKSIAKENKAIIIDDLHRISPKHLNKFLQGIENIFDIIIVASEENTQFDIVQMVKDNIKTTKEFKKASISRLYAEKRLELIQKIVSIKSDGDLNKASQIARVLDQCLNSYKLAFRADIDFVVQFVDYYCGHMGELDKSDATVFSKVFEASIERAIVPHLFGRRENPNDIIVALSEVAHYIHFHKEYPITAEHISGVIKEYCDYYDNRYLSAERFIKITTESGLLVGTSSGYEYRFASKNHLAYFVAKALNRKFHDTGDTTDLELIVKQSCFSINGDILLFMTYISDNVNIPRLLLHQAESYLSDWTEFDFANNNVKYLQSMPPKKLSAPKENEKAESVHLKAEQEEEHDALIETLDIYDYDETKIDELNNQLIRAFLQLRIIARNFSAFISILPAPAKKEYVSAMYQLPNKIFNRWAESVNNSLDQLVAELEEWQAQPNFEGKKLTREDILHYFQDVSLNLLLNLYYTVTTFGASDNTVDYLAQQEYIADSLNYRIERLMFYEKVDDYQAVVKDAEEIVEDQEDGMIKNMVISILRHLIVHSDRILDRERRRLSSTYFPPSAQTKILLERRAAQSEN